MKRRVVVKNDDEEGARATGTVGVDGGRYNEGIVYW